MNGDFTESCFRFGLGNEAVEDKINRERDLLYIHI